ncbi:MAG: aminopeptidase [Lachnospiraceae bacterium]|nr:aminopeptidase [Lachnospiraceae bacterium]
MTQTDALQRYIETVNDFLARVEDAYSFVTGEDAHNAPLTKWQELNHGLYEDVLPEHYEVSFANPAYAVSCFDAPLGQALSALLYELRTVISFVFDKDREAIDVRMRLWKEVLSLTKDGAELPEEAALIQCLRTYFETHMEKERKRSLAKQLLHEKTELVRVLTEEDLFDLRTLYMFGEHVSENEMKCYEYLNSLPEEKIDLMARTFVEGFCEGFVMTNKDLSIKETVRVDYDLGFERLVKRVMERFREKGLVCTVSRSVGGIFFLPNDTPGGRGMMGSRCFEQYHYDHKDDNALFLDHAFQEMRLSATRAAYEEYRTQARLLAGPAAIESFGRALFVPKQKKEALQLTKEQQKEVTFLRVQMGMMANEFIPQEERSFTIISFPVPEIGEAFPEIFDEVIKINTLDNALYRRVQQSIIDVLDACSYCVVKGMGDNKTDMKVMLHPLADAAHESRFENCVADVNIPVGEVFTSPKLTGTEGTLHVTGVYLNELYYKDLSFTFENGKVKEYSCGNFDTKEEGRKYIEENILFHHETLPIGEFAIGTNTTAYVAARKLHIEDKLPILIAEKTGPHFALGDTCYSYEEDVETFNPDGKRLVAKDNEVSCRRKEAPEQAYFSCHTDITIPYDELGYLAAVREDGTEVAIIENGRFVLPGTEPLNEAFED